MAATTSCCLVLEACSDVACCTRGRRRVIDGRIETRENLCMTVGIDHDIIDGAPAAPLTQRFTELIESGYGLWPVLTAAPFAGR